MNRRRNPRHAAIDGQRIGHDFTRLFRHGRPMLHRLRLHREVSARTHALGRRRGTLHRLRLHRKVSAGSHGQVVGAGLSRGQGAVDRRGDFCHATGDGQGVGDGDVVAGLFGGRSCLMDGLHGQISRGLHDGIVGAGLSGSA